MRWRKDRRLVLKGSIIHVESRPGSQALQWRRLGYSVKIVASTSILMVLQRFTAALCTAAGFNPNGRPERGASPREIDTFLVLSPERAAPSPPAPSA